MQFKIKDIGDEGLVLDVPITADWLAAACPDLEVKPGPSGINVHGLLETTGDDVLLRADVRGNVETSCSRCLEPARLALDIPIAVTFVEREVGDPEEADDPDVIYYDGDEIDLAPEIRDEILLAIPINPTCQEGCRGLCAVCGGNRNVTPCGCEAKQQTVQSKLSALAKIKL